MLVTACTLLALLGLQVHAAAAIKPVVSARPSNVLVAHMLHKRGSIDTPRESVLNGKDDCHKAERTSESIKWIVEENVFEICNDHNVDPDTYTPATHTSICKQSTTFPSIKEVDEPQSNDIDPIDDYVIVEGQMTESDFNPAALGRSMGHRNIEDSWIVLDQEVHNAPSLSQMEHFELVRDALCESPLESDDAETVANKLKVWNQNVVFVNGNKSELVSDHISKESDVSVHEHKAIGCSHHLENAQLNEVSDSVIVELVGQALCGKTERALKLSPNDLRAVRNTARQIQIDLKRTSRDVFSDFASPQTGTLFRILFAYSLLHPDVGYNQAMSFVAASLLVRDFGRPSAGDARTPPYYEIAAFKRFEQLMDVPHLGSVYDAKLSGWMPMFAALHTEILLLAKRTGCEEKAAALWQHMNSDGTLICFLGEMMMTQFSLFEDSDDLASLVHDRLIRIGDAYILARATAYVLLEHADELLGREKWDAVIYLKNISTRRPKNAESHSDKLAQTAFADPTMYARMCISWRYLIKSPYIPRLSSLFWARK